MTGRIFPGCGEKFVKRNEDHDACHGGKQEAEGGFVQKRAQNDKADNSTERFGDPGQKGIPEGFFPAAGGIVDGH